MSILDILDRPIAYHRVFVTLTGSVKGAVLLSQAVYWQKRAKQADGWWYKTAEEWQEETGLTRHEQDKARKDCEKYLKSDLRGVPATNYWKVDEDALSADLLAGKQQASLPENGKQDFRFSENIKRNTETTTETTHAKGKKMKLEPLAQEWENSLSGKPSKKQIIKMMSDAIDLYLEENKKKGGNVNNKEWDAMHDFPKELAAIVKKLEKGLGVSNMMRDENAVEVYRWVSEQDGLEKFIEWATSPERAQFIGKYKNNPGLIKIDWKVAVGSATPRTSASEVRF